MNVEPIDTAFLVRSLQEQVVQYNWRHTLDRVQIDFLMLFCLLLMLMLVLVYFYMKRRLRKAVQVERRQRIFQEAHYRNARLYEEQQMKQQLEEAVALAQQEQLPKDGVEALAESGIFRLFHRARMEDVRVTEDDWKALREAIDTAYPSFVTRLYALVPKLSAIELQISLLVKINVSVTDIAYHVSRTKQAVAVSRARLYKKMTGNDGSADQFDKYIMEM